MLSDFKLYAKQRILLCIHARQNLLFCKFLIICKTTHIYVHACETKFFRQDIQLMMGNVTMNARV